MKKGLAVKTALSRASALLAILAVCSVLSFSGCVAKRVDDSDSNIIRAQKRLDRNNDDSNKGTGTKAGGEDERNNKDGGY